MSNIFASSSTPKIPTGQPQKTAVNPAQKIEQPTQAQQQKAAFNISILESAAAILGVKDEPLALVLSSTLEEINKVLAPELGDNAIQKTADAGLDVSPEATAERIVRQSTALFSAFQARHEGDNEASVITRFIDTISQGIETGFSEARDILEGLEVLEGDIANDIDQTFTLVQSKLAAFQTMLSERQIA
jgi:transaldolase